MFIIDLDFASYDDTPVSALLGSMGVYTIWANGATDRPTYIGEGHVIARLPDHVNTWKRGIAGAIAILADTGRHKANGKYDGKIAEAFLLELGKPLKRGPTQNERPGCTERLRELVEATKKVRVNIRGLNPFTHPDNAWTRLTERAECGVELDDDGAFLFTSPWNARATRYR